MGDKRVAAVGEMVVQAAKSLGLAGIIVDGPNTDTRRLRLSVSRYSPQDVLP